MEEKIKCLICGHTALALQKHLRHKHGISSDEYRAMFGTDVKISFPRNLTKPEYWVNHGYSITESKERAIHFSNVLSNAGKKSDGKYPSCIEHWTRKGFSEKEAQAKVYEFQSKQSAKSKKFKGKNHTEESKRKIGNTMSNYIRNVVGCKEWHKHFGNFSCGYSKIQMECYEEIKNFFNIPLQANIEIEQYIVDMLYENKVIEFFGDYWHANPIFYKECNELKFPNKSVIAKELWDKDKNRIEFLDKCGYKVFVIWEYDWKNKKEYVLNKLKDFI